MTYNLIRTGCMLLSVLLLGFNTYASNDKTDNRDSLKKAVTLPKIDNKNMRSFPQLEHYIESAKTTFAIPFEQTGAKPEFGSEFINSQFTVTEVIADARSQAQNTMDEIERKGNYSTFLTPNDLVDLPVGLKKKLGNTNVTIGVSKAKFLPEYSLLTVFCKIDLPQGKSIFFGADSVMLSHKGGLVGKADLVLLGDFPIPLNGGNMMITLKGGLDMKTGNVKGLTYVKLECGGVKEMGLAADVSFPRSLLVPLTTDLKVEPNTTKKVQGYFESTVSDWNDIMADISLPPFAIKGLERVAFRLDKAVFDLSDKRNDPSVIFPANYTNLIEGQRELWRGLYIKEFDVILPKEFEDKSKSGPVTFKAQKLLVDNTGVTGLISANNILTTGTASGWDFSIDKFEIELQSNSIRKAGFNGAIAIPVSKKKNATDPVQQYGLAYKAVFLSNSDYLMNVSLKDSVAFDIWKAKAKILPGSYVELANVNEKFRPKAVLSGELNVNVTENGKSDLALGKVGFQGLTLQTVEPYISIEGGGFALKKANNALANFPITIDAVRLNIVGKEVMLALDTIRVNLMEKGENKLSARGSVAIVGQVDKVNNDIVFDYKRLLVNDIGVNANFGGFSLNGKINLFREHPIMGTGLSGHVDMRVRLGRGDTVAIDATAAFGRKTYRYWYVDLLATGFEIPIGAGFKITGLGGGASYQMQRHTSVQGANISQVCPSGIGYIPDSTAGVGFRAMATFVVGSEKAAQGDVTIEMLFNKTATGSGLARMGLYGKATIVPPQFLINLYDSSSFHLSKLAGNLKEEALTIERDTASHNESVRKGEFGKLAVKSKDTNKLESEGSIYASVGMEYDFKNKILDGNFQVLMNVAGGLIRGSNRDTAGWAKIHFESRKWYIHMGTPENQLGVNFDIGIGAIQTRAYLMIGDSLGSAPAPPTEVATLLGKSVQDLSYMRDLNALKNGGGFAFGSSIKAQLNSEFGKLFKFYTRFSAGAGFDIMLKRYLDNSGNPARCVNQTSPLGINGWYANGQAYAYLSGTLGIKAKLKSFEKEIDIITAGAAVLLQTKAPNPTWMQGYLAGKFSVLSGAIKGSFSCKVTLGQNCDIEGVNPIDEKVEFITKIVPEDKTTNVDPLGTIQAFFKYPVGQPFYLNNGQSGEQIEFNKNELTSQDAQTFANIESASILLKARLLKFELVNKLDKIVSKRDLIWSSDNMSVEYPNHLALAGRDTITATVEVAFDVYNGSSWLPFVIDGQAVTQKKIVTFSTAPRPQYIPLSNVEYSYPIIEQKYFYPGEYNKGFIKLKRSQSYLFVETSDLTLSFTKKDGTSVSAPIIYNDNLKEFSFDMPTLEKNTAYKMNITATKPNATTTFAVAPAPSEGSPTPTPNPIVNNVLTYNFNSSRHNTFSEKLTSYKPKYYFSQPDYRRANSSAGFGGVFMGFKISADIEEIEPFDIAEVKGTLLTNRKPLINPISLMNDAYYQEDIIPFLSPGYSNLRVSRDINIFGNPPAKAVVPELYTSIDTSTVDRFPYIHTVSSVFAQDLEDFKIQLFKLYPPSCSNGGSSTEGGYYSDTSPCEPTDKNSEAYKQYQKYGCTYCCSSCVPNLQPWQENLYFKPLPLLREGKYDVSFKYVLPNGLETSQPVFSYYHINSGDLTVDAGADQIKTSDSFTMNATGNTGTWAIVQAPAGFTEANISSLNSPYATVTGVPVNSDIILRWTIVHSSGATLSDIVTLTRVSAANAGEDQTSGAESFTLAGNARGKWTIMSDEACVKTISISDVNNPNATVTNMPLNKPVTLRWTLADNTETLFDDVVLTRQLPVDFAGNDIIQADSVFQLSAKYPVGIWRGSASTYFGILDSTNAQTDVVVNEPNKPVTLTWEITDKCNQKFIDTLTLLWAKADLGGDQCKGEGSFTATGYGNGTWAIASATEGVSINLDSFITKVDAYTSVFTMPASRLSVNNFINLSWTLVSGESDEVQFRRVAPISAGIDQSQNESVFTLNASIGNGEWSIASAPSSFTLTNIEDVYNPKTKVTLPENTTVQLVWTIQESCRQGSDTVQLTRKGLTLVEGLAGKDKITFNAFPQLNATGTGQWSIVRLPIGTDTTDNGVFYTGEYNNPNTFIWLSKIPVDSTIIFRWITPNGEYDDVSFTYKAAPVVKAKIILERFYNPTLGYMVRPSNIDSLVASCYPGPVGGYTDYLKYMMNYDTNIVCPISFNIVNSNGSGGGYYTFLKKDGTVGAAGDSDELTFWEELADYNSVTGYLNGAIAISKYNLTRDTNNNITSGTVEEAKSQYMELRWGQIITVNFTDGSIITPDLIQKPHPSGIPIFVLKAR